MVLVMSCGLLSRVGLRYHLDLQHFHFGRVERLFPDHALRLDTHCPHAMEIPLQALVRIEGGVRVHFFLALGLVAGLGPLGGRSLAGPKLEPMEKLPLVDVFALVESVPPERSP